MHGLAELTLTASCLLEHPATLGHWSCFMCGFLRYKMPFVAPFPGSWRASSTLVEAGGKSWGHLLGERIHFNSNPCALPQTSPALPSLKFTLISGSHIFTHRLSDGVTSFIGEVQCNLQTGTEGRKKNIKLNLQRLAVVIDARYGWSRELKIAAPKSGWGPAGGWNIQYWSTRGRAAGGGKRECDGGPFLKMDVMDRKMNGRWKDEGKARDGDAFQFKRAACENIGSVPRLPAVSAILSTVPRNGNSRLGFKCFLCSNMQAWSLWERPLCLSQTKRPALVFSWI